jgi:hypothetical protein
MKYKEFRSVIDNKLGLLEPPNALIFCLNAVINDYPQNETSYRKAFFIVLKDEHQMIALSEVEPVINSLTDLKFLNSVKNRAKGALRSGFEETRSLYKKVLLREIELNFNLLVAEGKVDVGLSELSIKLEQYPYLARTAYKRFARMYASNNQRLYEFFSSNTK